MSLAPIRFPPFYESTYFPGHPHKAKQTGSLEQPDQGGRLFRKKIRIVEN